jgi:uncharacterized membrane protein
MRTTLKWVLATLGLAVVIHVLTVAAVPRAVMYMASKRILNKSGAGVNRLLHAPRVTVNSRDVVKPSPDLLYSLCVYDVSTRPLRVIAPVPDTYWSISFYQSNTDNFYVLNDRQAKTNPVKIVLVGPDMPVPDIADAEVVVAPAARGVFLLRSLIMDEGKLDDLIKKHKMASCTLY